MRPKELISVSMYTAPVWKMPGLKVYLKRTHITSINAMVKISKWYKQKRPPPRSDNVLLTPQNLLTFA